VCILAFIVASLIFCVTGLHLFGDTQACLGGRREWRKDSRRNEAIMVFAFVFAAFAAFIGDKFVSQERPGHFWEKAEYEREFYVNVFPEGAASKNYRLPGMVQASTEEDYDSAWRVYRLEYVRWPNGGRTFFDSDESLELGKKVSLSDDTGRGWEVELTDHKVSGK
jgi:hypothetical protein